MLILVLPPPGSGGRLKVANFAPPDLLLMTPLFVFPHQGKVLEFVAAGKAAHLFLVHMGPLIVNPQLCGIHVVQGALVALKVALRVPFPVHSQSVGTLEAAMAHLTLVQRFHGMELLQVQLVLANAAELLLAESAVDRILHLAETLVTVQASLLVEDLVAHTANIRLRGHNHNLCGSVHSGVVFSGRTLIFEDTGTSWTVLLDIAVHFCRDIKYFFIT